VTPIDFRMDEVSIRVEARDRGLLTSRLMAAAPYEILGFIRRGASGPAGR
jgi:plasmid replication initiation protein